MQITEQEVIFVVIVGSLTFIILTIFFSSLIVIFQKNIQKKQKQLFRAVLETQEKERQRIGKDLHDEMGPLLSAVKLNLEALNASEHLKKSDNESIVYINTLLDEAVSGIRSSAHDLMPGTLAKYGLISAVEEIAERINKGGKTRVILENKGFPETIEALSKLNIYRIIQELINNTLKHANATELKVSFKTSNKSLHIHVEDNGIGFNLGPENPAKSGIGLKNIESRVKLLGGTYKIGTAGASGTRVDMLFEYTKLA